MKTTLPRDKQLVLYRLKRVLKCTITENLEYFVYQSYNKFCYYFYDNLYKRFTVISYFFTIKIIIVIIKLLG